MFGCVCTFVCICGCICVCVCVCLVNVCIHRVGRDCGVIVCVCEHQILQPPFLPSIILPSSPFPSLCQKNYSTIVRTKDLDSSLMVVSDSSEAVTLLLSNQIVAFLNKNASSVEYIHLSDLYTGATRDRRGMVPSLHPSSNPPTCPQSLSHPLSSLL